MKLEYIQYILEIYRTKSINKASESLLLSQPYLSKCLKETEKQLGVELVRRHAKGVDFTPIGEKFIEYALTIETFTKKIESLKLDYTQTKDLQISCFHSFNLIELIHAIDERHIVPNCHLRCFETQNANVFEKVKSHESDLGIIYLDTSNMSAYFELFKKYQLDFIPLQTDYLYAIMSSQHPLHEALSLTKEAILPYKLLIEQHKLNFMKENNDQHPLNTYFKAFKKETVLFDHHSSFLYFLSKNPAAFSIGQKNFNTSNPLIIHGSLTYIPIVDTPFQLTTGFLYRSSNHLIKEIEMFIYEMTQTFNMMVTSAPPLD